MSNAVLEARDTGLLEVQFSLVGHGRSLQSSR